MSEPYFLHQSIYIPSLEAADIYEHTYREKEVKVNFVGMLPSSLELNKLVSSGLKSKTKKETDKITSLDIINVKFNKKVISAKQIVKKVTAKINKLEDTNVSYLEKLHNYTHQITEQLENENWSEYSANELRTLFYVRGFTFNNCQYVVYKRSSAKSRVGQCLFIKASLYKKMIQWSRLGLKFSSRDEQIDYPSLLAYESLVGSSLEDIIYIHPSNILIISDLYSHFEINANTITSANNGYLNSSPKKCTITNSLFDGESLLDSSYFNNGKSMMLLRNHMFKSAAFNCNIQQFLQDHCPEGVRYDEWQLRTMFDGVHILAKDVHLIITPSSLKALKFSSLLKDEVHMWNHWKQKIEEDGCMFGICKYEKETKRNFLEVPRPIQQLSYQMLNSLPIKPEDIHILIKLEKRFISKLKNDDDFFISHIKEHANEINCNRMFADIYQQNKDVVHTHIFKKFRRELISSHVTHVKRGKLRLEGDYCVLLGNPMEFLYHALGKVDPDNVQSLSLHANEIYTALFDEKEVTGFRNPHTSPSNVLVAKNKICNDINTYFNLTNNIVCVNAIRYPLQDILSGADYDSDTVLLSDDPHLLHIAKRVFNKYPVCINEIESSKKQYTVTPENMAIIDNELSVSQKNIGTTVNIGQICMSRYWHLMNTSTDQAVLDELLKKINVVAILSGICIDLAKKMFRIDINYEIKNIQNTKYLIKEKPLFWKYISHNESGKNIKYECPMDFLYLEMNHLETACYKNTIPFENLLQGTKNHEKIDRKQEKKIVDYVKTMCSNLNSIYLEDSTDEEKNEKINDTIKYYKFYLNKLSIKSETMYSLVLLSTRKSGSEISTRLLNMLYVNNRDIFLAQFQTKTPQSIK